MTEELQLTELLENVYSVNYLLVWCPHVLKVA